MGGLYAPDLTNRTDYLVASEVGSEKYFVACQRSIPIVRPDWLLACWKECALLTPHVCIQKSQLYLHIINAPLLRSSSSLLLPASPYA